MDTLQERLAALADDAPTGGAPATELWARGRRTHRLKVTALAATALVLGIVGAGAGARLADRGGEGELEPAGTVGFTLPIDYPAGEDLPDLGKAPGPLAAAWLASRGEGELDAVGLVAETGEFGTVAVNLPIDNPPADVVGLALSADGRMLAYPSPRGELTVRDLTTGVDELPFTEFGTRPGFFWADATHLVGHVAAAGDADGWVWRWGTEPKRVDYWDYGRRFDLWATDAGGGPGECAQPTLLDTTGLYGEPVPGWGDQFVAPPLCDLLGIVDPQILLGHSASPDDDLGTVVALDLRGAKPPFDDPDLRRVVVDAGTPDRVTFAADLIGEALGVGGGAS